MDAGSSAKEIVMGLALAWEREKTRLMKESLRADEVALLQKELEFLKLMEKKERMLGKRETQDKLLDDFMVFIGAVENNDAQMGRNFDEKAMMDAVAHMLKSDGNSGGNVEGSGGVQGRENNLEVTIEGAARDGGGGSNAGGKSGSCNGDNRK